MEGLATVVPDDKVLTIASMDVASLLQATRPFPPNSKKCRVPPVTAFLLIWTFPCLYCVGVSGWLFA